MRSSAFYSVAPQHPGLAAQDREVLVFAVLVHRIVAEPSRLDSVRRAAKRRYSRDPQDSTENNAQNSANSDAIDSTPSTRPKP